MNNYIGLHHLKVIFDHSFFFPVRFSEYSLLKLYFCKTQYLQFIMNCTQMLQMTEPFFFFFFLSDLGILVQIIFYSDNY